MTRMYNSMIIRTNIGAISSFYQKFVKDYYQKITILGKVGEGDGGWV